MGSGYNLLLNVAMVKTPLIFALCMEDLCVIAQVFYMLNHSLCSFGLWPFILQLFKVRMVQYKWYIPTGVLLVISPFSLGITASHSRVIVLGPLGSWLMITTLQQTTMTFHKQKSMWELAGNQKSPSALLLT